MKRNILIFFIFLMFGTYAQNKTETYISEYSQIAVDEMNRYNIPASITLAQGILESGNGDSRLATEGKNRNVQNTNSLLLLFLYQTYLNHTSQLNQ